jgi:hypothetical protein
MYKNIVILMDAPRLIESSAKDFLYSTLSKCHNNRVHIYTIALNIGVLIGFFLITFIILYYCYKKKPSEYEAKQKLLRDQQYILSKIRFYQGENIERRTSDITSLPIMR